MKGRDEYSRNADGNRHSVCVHVRARGNREIRRRSGGAGVQAGQHRRCRAGDRDQCARGVGNQTARQVFLEPAARRSADDGGRDDTANGGAAVRYRGGKPGH